MTHSQAQYQSCYVSTIVSKYKMLGRMHTRLSMLLVLFSSVTRSQVFPLSYTFPTAETMSVNGSSATGNCSSVTANILNGLSKCDAPTTSVLFDGKIPTLTGLDGDTWASQLFTLQTNATNRREIISDLKTPSYAGVERVELVTFNCPKWGIAVETIKLFAADSVAGARSSVETFTVPNITSCDSLVKICISQNIESKKKAIFLEFNPPPGFSWVHLAEVEFYGNHSACPPDTIIAIPQSGTTINTQPADATTIPSPQPSDINTPMSNADEWTNMRSSSSFSFSSFSISSYSSSSSSTISTVSTSSTSSTSTITIAASVGCVVLLIVCLLAAVLILWRCYYVKHHKHNTSHHPAVGEGHANTHSHPPPVTLCEETGQVYYSTPQEVVPQDTYSHAHQDSTTGRGVSKKSREGTAAEDVEMGGYSMLSYGDKPQDGGLDNQNEEILLTPAKQDEKNEAIGDDGLHAMSVHQLYTQEDKKMEKDGDSTHLHTPEADTPVDQLYAQVDKKKKDGDTTHSHAEIDTPTDQLYAQVDKKKKDGVTTHSHTEIDTPTDQLYAQVDKKKSKGKVVCEDSPQESGAVYSVVKKPHPPQLPAKSDLLMSDLYNN